MTDLPSVRQNFPAADPQEVIQLADPIVHVHGFSIEGLQFGKIQIHGDNPIQRIQLFRTQIIFRDLNIASGWLDTTPGCQSHVRFAGIGAFNNDFGGSMSVGRPMYLILNHHEKFPRHGGAGIIVDAGGINFEHLPPKNLFRRADIPYASEQFIKVIAATHLLETLIIQRKPVDDIFSQPLSGPNAELRAAMGFDELANGDNDIEVKMVGSIVFAISGSY